MNQREYFDSVAHRWDDMVLHDGQIIAQLLAMCDIRQNSRVLDVGAGTGVLIPYLLPLIGDNGTLVELDISPNMLSVAKQKTADARVQFHCADVLEADVGPFDTVVCYSMFPHFDDKPAALQKMASMLTSGGRLAVLHSQSRQAINNLHQTGQSEAIREARLAELPVLEGWFQKAGLNVVCSVDSERLFAVVGEKGESRQQ